MFEAGLHHMGARRFFKKKIGFSLSSGTQVHQIKVNMSVLPPKP
jgi:hypothetical protein